jgi:hypothetical protein
MNWYRVTYTAYSLEHPMSGAVDVLAETPEETRSWATWRAIRHAVGATYNHRMACEIVDVAELPEGAEHASDVDPRRDDPAGEARFVIRGR